MRQPWSADDEYIFAGGDYIFALGEQRKNTMNCN